MTDTNKNNEECPLKGRMGQCANEKCTHADTSKHELSQSIKHAMNKQEFEKEVLVGDTLGNASIHDVGSPATDEVCKCRYEGEEKCCHEDCKICNPKPASAKSKYDDPNYRSDFDRFVEEHPITDVSWEESLKVLLVEHNAFKIIEFVREQIDLAIKRGETRAERDNYAFAKKEGYDAGKKTAQEWRGGTGRVMYYQGYEEGFAVGTGSREKRKQDMYKAGRKEAIAEMDALLRDDITASIDAFSGNGFVTEDMKSFGHVVIREARGALEALSNK